MTKKINTKEVLKFFNGKPAKNAEGKDFTVAEAIGEILLGSKSEGKMKLFKIAERFHDSNGVVDLDDSDFGLVKGEIERSTLYTVFVVGNLLTIFEKAEKKSEKSKK